MEENKNNKLGLGILIGLLLAIIIGLVGFIVYDKVISKDNNNEQVEQGNNSEKENVKEETVNCIDCITEIVLPSTYADQKTTEGKIVLGNKIMNLKVTIDSEEEHGYGSVSVDDKLLKKFYFENMESIDSVYILKNDLLMITTVGSYIRSSKYYFYDTNLQEINTNFVIDDEYPNSMKNSGDIGEKLTVENNVITVVGSRLSLSDEIELENGETTRICDYDLLNSDGTISNIKGTYDEHKGEIAKAKYEIEYLENGKFGKSKRVEILKKVDESFCN